MKFDPNIHHRRSIRLQNYDYSQSGAYFITICTQNRQCLFGNVVYGKMILNEFGNIVKNFWLEIPQHFRHVVLDEFVVMPNHVHGIIMLNENGTKNKQNVRAKNFSPLHNNRYRSPSRTLGSIVRGFKIGVTKWFRQNTDIYTV